MTIIRMTKDEEKAKKIKYNLLVYETLISREKLFWLRKSVLSFGKYNFYVKSNSK